MIIFQIIFHSIHPFLFISMTMAKVWLLVQQLASAHSAQVWARPSRCREDFRQRCENHVKMTTKYKVMWVWSLRRREKQNYEISHIDRTRHDSRLYKQIKNPLLHIWVCGVEGHLIWTVQMDVHGWSAWTHYQDELLGIIFLKQFGTSGSDSGFRIRSVPVRVWSDSGFGRVQSGPVRFSRLVGSSRFGSVPHDWHN